MEIVVVDRCDADREELVELLVAAGFSASGVGDGREAELYLGRHPDAELALVDIATRGDGGAALRAISPGLKVVLLATCATMARVADGIRDGACDFLVKPWAADIIVPAVKRVGDEIELRRGMQNSEMLLLRSEQFLGSVLESLGEAVVVIGRDMRIISANREYRDQSGRSEGNILGRHCYEVSHGFTRPCHLVEEDCVCAVIETFKDGKPHKAVHVHRDRDDNPLYVEIKSFPLSDGDGCIHAVVECIRDITQIIKLAEDKKRTEAQLQQAQRMEAVGQLAGGVAHDFNNTLTAILGFAELMRMRMPADDPCRPFAEEIIQSGRGAAELVRGLLAFSRKQTMDLQPLELNRLLADIRPLLEEIIREDIGLRLLSSREELPVMADDNRLRQIFLHLAANARDAMPEGGELLIKTGRLAIDEDFVRHCGYGEPGEYAWVSFSDTGTGMDEETREKICEPFFSTKKFGKGTGLGLAMAYGTVKQHHGYLKVDSESGQGSTFLIYLPLLGTAGLGVGAQIDTEKSEKPHHANRNQPTRG